MVGGDEVGCGVGLLWIIQELVEDILNGTGQFRLATNPMVEEAIGNVGAVPKEPHHGRLGPFDIGYDAAPEPMEGMHVCCGEVARKPPRYLVGRLAVERQH